jgi:predicted nucleic acid-binding protein
VPPRLIFVDTGAWYALQVTDDQFHQAAAAAFPKILAQYDALVTSNHVVGETYTLLRTTKGFREAWRFLEAMEESPRVEVRFTSAELEQEACALLREFQEVPLSFVDAVSLCVMRREQIAQTFAFDPHFARAGIRCLPLDLSL